MTFQASVLVRTALGWAVALVCAFGTPAHAGRTPVDPTRVLPSAGDSLDAAHLRLGRAAMEQTSRNPRGVIENLEPLDFSAPTFDEADRAAFLLAQAYLQLGSVERFSTLARRVATWDRKSAYTRWLAYELLLVQAERGAPGAPADSSLETSGWRSLAETDATGGRSPLAAHLDALRLERAGADDTAELTALAAADTTSVVGRDLAGAALIRLATRAIARNTDASALLEQVPARSRYHSRARHMLGLLALEHGETDRGVQLLEALLAQDSTYAQRREVWLSIAGQALEHGRWQVAQQTYEAIEQDRQRHHEALKSLLAQDNYDALWSYWQLNPQVSEALMLDARPAGTLAEQLATASADLASRPTVDLPALDAPRPDSAWRWPVAPPDPAAWSALSASERRVAEAAQELARTQWKAEREREGLQIRREYFGDGQRQVRHEIDRLYSHAALLDSLQRSLDSLDARLRRVRDVETRRVLARSVEVLEICAKNLLWMHAMQRLSIDGPNHARAVAAPLGYPGPDSVLAQEEALVRAVQAAVDRLAAESPARIAASYEQSWRPSLIDRAARLAPEAGRTLALARALDASIDSTLAATWTTASLQRLDARIAALAVTTDSLREEHVALRAHLARAAIERALAAIQAEREAIDYGMAASSYGSSVHLTLADTSNAAVAPRTAVATVASDSLPPAPGDGEEFDDPETAKTRTAAIATLKGFLDHYPASPARAEMRFRLADLLLIDARQTFREQMAQFVRDQAEGHAGNARVPLLDHRAALDLYRRILAEDRDFPHLDAVRFNAGMILADDGDPEAARFFTELVTLNPQSPYCQEAYLRMGDMKFNERQIHEGVALYQHAAAGTDVGLKVIALYKMGWAHFNEDRFVEAADAFGSVLDLYRSEHRAEIQADIEGEAESYLVYSLAGAGGADAFAAYFDRVGPRPYEMKVLMTMGQHFRHYSKFPEAAEVDQLSLRRYPDKPEALIAVQRLIETYQRSDRPQLQRAARLEYAARFAPGGSWYVAQTSDSVRAAGEDFARSSLKSVAFERHRMAREGGTGDDWKEALRLYETLLTTWPQDAEVPTLQLNAGEASAQLRDYPSALQHYEAAAGGPDSLAALAMWQKVAVTDAWYESTRTGGTGAPAGMGRDTLARAVIDAGDRLLARFPEHPRSADLVWRQSQLSLAHGWNERAIQDLDRMTKRYPTDARAPIAASQRGDALFRLGDFAAAGAAFEDALVAAQRTGRDSLARAARAAIPICYYRQAEAAVAADSTQYERNAQLFEKVATNWPEYEHAHRAQYRAGLAYVRAGKSREAVRAMQTLIERFPKSEFVRDAHIQIAQTWEAGGERELAAEAYLDFAKRYPGDESVRASWLKAADLLAAANLEARADELRLQYIAKFPDDIETAMEILEALALRELAAVGPGQPIAKLLAANGGTRKQPAPLSHLADYLKRGTTNPKLVSRGLLSQVRFLQAEEAQPAFTAARLSQPLPKSIPVKQRLLDTLMVRYRRSVDLGVAEWAHASTFRIGQSLVAFGEALEASERPADLQGDDLLAYEDVLMEQSQAFYNRGEGVWTELLRQNGRADSTDTWVAQAQSALWQRLAKRFYYRPEAEFPLVAVNAPHIERAPKDNAKRAKDAASHAARPAKAPKKGKR